MIVHLCWAAVLCLAVTPSYASAAWSLPLSSPYALAAEWSNLVFDWMQHPAAPQGSSFRLDSAIHHSTHPDHFGKSAVYKYGNDARIAATAPAIGGLKTTSQRVTRLRDPKAYLVQRERILSSSRLSMASGGPSTAISTLDSLHDLLEWEDVDLLAPDVTSRATLLALARMSSAAYEAPPEPPAWTPTDGFEKWNVSMSFGWIENGIRGHVFRSNDEDDIVVVALKGTSAAILPGGDDTARRDKLNDNLLFSCCCARVSWTWSPVCPCPFSATTCSQPCLERSLLHQSVYYPLITDLYNNISYYYPTSQIWVTGHSLGGALGSLIGYTFGVPVVTFEGPAERMAAKRLHLPLPRGARRRGDGDGKVNEDDKTMGYEPPVMPVTHVFHSADPIPMGTCTGPSSLCGSAGYAMESECHAGQVVLYNTTGLLGWSTNIATHRIATMTDDLLSSDWGERVRKEYKAKKKGSMFKRSWWPWRGSHDVDKDDEEWLGKIGEVPAVTNQNDCVDCESWKFVEDDKWK